MRTEALLYVSGESGIDPLQLIEELGAFEDFSIRAAVAAFFASPGPGRNIEAARAILEGMVRSEGPSGARDRAEAARLLAVLPAGFNDLAHALIGDADPEVARHALRSAPPDDELIPAIVTRAGIAGPGDRRRRPHWRASASASCRTSSGSWLDPTVPIEIRRELPGVLVRIGTPAAEQVLMESLLQGDAVFRFRVVSSLNKLRESNPHLWIDPRTIEVLLAAEIAGHYRSYQVLGPLRAALRPDSPPLTALNQAMAQELERIFRLMALAHPIAGLHDAYVGVRSPNPAVRANALEFLENVLPPALRHVLRAADRQPGVGGRAHRAGESARGRPARDRGAGGDDAARE